MKLVRWGQPDKEKPGLIDSTGKIRDLSDIIRDVTPDILPELSALKSIDQALLPKVEGTPRLGACFTGIPNIYCIGLNYIDHANEMGIALPDEPILFSKATSSLSGPYDPIIAPDGSSKLDYEIELALIIGKESYNIPQVVASTCIAGYCIANDVSERDYQLNQGGQYIKGKSAPTFCPLGPWFVTADEITDPHNLSLKLSVNNNLMQNSNTSNMVFKAGEIVSYLSRFLRLMPGDVILTGTPAGVGMGKSPQYFLKPGDVLTLDIENLGQQRMVIKE